jgi:DNA-binding MurR/RpiR family transcriptional regulator
VAVLSVTALAVKCDVHASSFVRFAQVLGYCGFKELQVLFQRRLSAATPGFDARVRALQAELGARADHSEIGFLRDLVVRDLTSLQDLLASIDAAQIARAVDLMEVADTIYLLGQLRSAPVVDLLCYVLACGAKGWFCWIPAAAWRRIWRGRCSRAICGSRSASGSTRPRW